MTLTDILTNVSEHCAVYQGCPYKHCDFDGDFWCNEECMREDAERIDW